MTQREDFPSDKAILEWINEAAMRLDGVINRTPLLESQALNELVGGRVLLKPENLQRSGSFKIRGAYNAIASLPSSTKNVVAWSSGNHAQGVAMAAKLTGKQAEIVMPHDTPENKSRAVEALGGRIIGYDRYTEDREAIAFDRAASLDCPVIPSYDLWPVVAGQGTTGLEIMSDPLLNGRPPDNVLVCCGGGGLTAGIALAVHAESSTTKVFAVEPKAADDTARSFAAGSRLANDPATRSVCDALLTPKPGALTFPINQRHLSDVLTVTDDQALRAMGYAHEILHLVLEPGGAVALAAVLAHAVELSNKTTVAVLSGGNVGDAMLAKGIAAFRAQNDSV
ncbi:MAG: threonine/serine dehydratase [Pseudomonadota bacterium]